MNKFSVYFFTCSNNKINFMSADLGQCFVSWLGNWVRIFHPLVQLKKTPENTCWMANLQMVICLSNLLVKMLPMLGPVTLRVLDKQDPFCFSVQKFFQSQIVSQLPHVCFFLFSSNSVSFYRTISSRIWACVLGQDKGRTCETGQSQSQLLVFWSQQLTQKWSSHLFPARDRIRPLLGILGKIPAVFCWTGCWEMRTWSPEFLLWAFERSHSVDAEPRKTGCWWYHWSHLFLLTFHLSDSNFFMS